MPTENDLVDNNNSNNKKFATKHAQAVHMHVFARLKKIPNQFGVYVNFVVWQTYFSTKGKNTDKKPTLFMHLFDALGREKEL